MGVGTHLAAISGVHAPQEEGLRPPRRVRGPERLRRMGRERKDRHPPTGGREGYRPALSYGEGSGKRAPDAAANGWDKSAAAHGPEGARAEGFKRCASRRKAGEERGDRRSRRRVPPLPAALGAVGVGGILGWKAWLIR